MTNLPTLQECEEAIGITTDEWSGRCYEIAGKILSELEVAFPPRTRLCYGHYLGPIEPENAYGRAGPIEQHGWLNLRNGTVYDPTRWAFVGFQPFIHIGPEFPEYDEGGNRIREKMLPTNPEWNEDEKIVHIPMGLTAAVWVQREYGTPSPSGLLTISQAAHLANRDPRLIQEAKDIFHGLELANLRGLIPIDNYDMVMED